MRDTRETIRTGRRANFYITENGFIDNYARDAGLPGIAVYHVLERYMNSETRSTWVGTAKIAETLGLSQRTVQRCLKTLEDLKLVRIVRTANMTVYVVLPVPSRPKTASTPLFERIADDEILEIGDTAAAWATPSSPATTAATREATSVSRSATIWSSADDTRDAPNKEEQDLLNKTNKQDENNSYALRKKQLDMAESDSFHSALQPAKQVMKMLSLPLTPGNITKITAAVAAEAAATGRSPTEAAEFITGEAFKDREKGVHIDGFYFENARYRSRGSHVGAKLSKSEQRKIDNLEINARVKQRLREKFGAS